MVVDAQTAGRCGTGTDKLASLWHNARDMSDTLNTVWETVKGLGLGVIAFQVVSAYVTHLFRDRTPEELEVMKVAEPKTFKFLELCKSYGVNSPRLWQLVLGILFARMNMPQPAPSVTNEKGPSLDVPPVEPPSDHPMS